MTEFNCSAQMKTIKTQRIIAGLLAVSGAWYAVLTVMAPPLWPGYVVWFGWVAVAFGRKQWQEKWFWLCSACWNLLLLGFVFVELGVNRPIDDFGFWHVRIHLALATLLSAYLSAIVPWDTWPQNRRT